MTTFRDNSDGIFLPHFDIVGPIQIDRSMYYTDTDKESDPHRKGTRTVELMVDACTAADDQVDFSQYDTDGDGSVDMIYFIFAGEPSYIAGNDPRLLWPLQTDISQRGRVNKDGVRLGRAACSTELFGVQSYGWSVLEGIGTMCHEFSHILGLPDFYDTDNMYDELCVNPDLWSVMANGADFETGRCPCAYSLFERYALGFAQPQRISSPASISIGNIEQTNAGYRIDTPLPKEYFLLENRQPIKWDTQLPGHGMLVFRVDSANASIWNNNCVNDNPSRPCYQLLQAGGTHRNANGYYATGSDPFPGTANVSQLDNLTSPANLKSWAGRNCSLGLRNIREEGGIVSFDVFDATVLTSISIEENVVLGVGTSLQLTPIKEPDYAPAVLTWISDDEQVATVSQEGLVTGVGEGTAVITLTANDSLTARCTVTVHLFPLVADIATFLALPPGDEGLLILTSAEVLQAYGSDIYLRDATGSIKLSGTGLSVKPNDVLSGSLYGRKAVLNSMPALVAVPGTTSATSVVATPGSEATPVNLHISQLDSTQYSNLVTVRKAELKSDGGMFAVLGDRRIRLYNTLKVSGIKVPTDLTRRYDVTAIYGTNTLGGETIDELYLLQSPVQADYTALTAVSLPAELQLSVGRTYQFAPTLTPALADVFLRWTCSNEQVATVSQDGTLTPLSDGLATITVTNLDNGISAQCHVTVGEIAVKQDIAAFKTLPDGGEAQLTLTDAHVLYVYNDHIYLRDASGAIRLAATLPLQAGHLVSGSIYGRYALVDDMPELQPVDGVTDLSRITVVGTQAVTPRTVTLSQLTAADHADLIRLESVRLTTLDALPGIYVTDDDRYVRVYNTFGIKNPVPTPYDDKLFTLTGILTTAFVSSQLIDNLSLTERAVEEPQPDAIAALRPSDNTPVTVYTPDGRLLLRTTSSLLPHLQLAGGLYVVKTDNRTVKIVKRP